MSVLNQRVAYPTFRSSGQVRRFVLLAVHFLLRATERIWMRANFAGKRNLALRNTQDLSLSSQASAHGR